MKNLQRIIVAFGVLDVAYVAWIAIGVLADGGIDELWQSTVGFGLPFPELQVAGIVLLYVAILACGLALILRRAALAWLNYVLLPLRILMGAPTIFPLFIVLSVAGVALPAVVAFVLVAVGEVLRVVLVYRWARVARHGLAGAATA